MEALVDRFSSLLDVSLTASIVILFVILVRLLLKRAPKVFSYALWGIVLLRLLVPVSIESSVSIIPKQTEFSPAVEMNQVLPEIPFETPADHAENTWHADTTLPGEPMVQVHHTMDARTYLTIGWLLGVTGMMLHSIVSYWKLRKRVRVAIPLKKGIFIADDIPTPFVTGIFRPVIFLPGGLEDTELRYIVAHERHHIRRGDHIFKALGFLALVIHWFNPLVWAAFILAGRDMEMSCDEAVIRKLGAHIRADYSASLLNLATGHRLFSITPLAFGEGNPTGRVRNLAKWKKPALWVTVICLVLCAVLAVCLLTDPKSPIKKEEPVAEPLPTEPLKTTPVETMPQADDWGVSLLLHEISKTEVSLTFLYDGSVMPGKVIYHDERLSLERMEDGHWVTVNVFPGYEPSETVFPITDGDVWCYSWKFTFGELPVGQYRLGKRVFTIIDGTEHMVYEEFFISDDTPIDPFPMEEEEPYADNGEKLEQVQMYQYLELFQSGTRLAQAVLEFEGNPLVTTTDAAQLEKLYQMFRNSDVLGYEPKTHSTGLRLHLILTFQDGKDLVIDLDPDRDVCKVGEEFVFYGAFDEPYYIEKIWEYFGISAWPDEVYAKYPGAYRE